MLTTPSAILQALRQGPGYGQLVARRVMAATGGRPALGAGSLYPALRALQKRGLVRGWTVVPGRERGGRSRRYFELTLAGMREAERQARAVSALILGRHPRTSPAAAEPAACRERLERVDRLFEFVSVARRSVPGSRRRP